MSNGASDWERGETFAETLRALTGAAEPQPAPIPQPGADTQSLVIADVGARRQMGIEKYGTPLQAHNGRDALMDAYQESLDLSCYLRQMIEERNDVASPPLEFGAQVYGDRKWRIATSTDGRRSLECFCGGDWDNADAWHEYDPAMPWFKTEEFADGRALANAVLALYEVLAGSRRT